MIKEYMKGGYLEAQHTTFFKMHNSKKEKC